VSDDTPAVHNFVDAYTSVWIGGKADEHNNWWMNGKPISKGNSRWHPGQPDGLGDCMVANDPNRAIWDNQRCSTNHNWICEYEMIGFEFAVDRFVKVVDWQEVEWQEAEKKCKEENGFMIVIDSQEIKEWVAEKGSFWVGASDLGHRGEWQWSNGYSLNKTSELWAPGAPDNQVDAEHCAVMQVEGINDVYCRKLNPYICQWSRGYLENLVC